MSFVESIFRFDCVEFLTVFATFLLQFPSIKHATNVCRLVIFLCKTDRTPYSNNSKEHRLTIHSIAIEYRHIYDALTTAVKTFPQFLLPFLT